jgi:L-ascorbate metabolism protein UlaG (beta-lactamase superfamily)
MELTWFGHACFRLSERGLATVVTDPYEVEVAGYQPLNLQADIVTCSQNVPGHNNLAAVKGSPYLIMGPGEYEIGGVFITGVQTNGHAHDSDQEQRNTLYLFDYNGLNILHLGVLNRVPSQAEVEALGPIHVALVPVGGASSLNASRAAEVINLLEPSIVVPMYYATPSATAPLEPLSKFLKAMGLVEVEVVPSLKINGKASLPEDTRVVVLDYPHD